MDGLVCIPYSFDFAYILMCKDLQGRNMSHNLYISLSHINFSTIMSSYRSMFTGGVGGGGDALPHSVKRISKHVIAALVVQRLLI